MKSRSEAGFSEFFVYLFLVYNVKKYRTKQGLSQEDFAKKSGVKYTTLTKIESNVIKKPSVLVMVKIAKALGVNIKDLIK